jgi:hypothetical protein
MPLQLIAMSKHAVPYQNMAGKRRGGDTGFKMEMVST